MLPFDSESTNTAHRIERYRHKDVEKYHVENKQLIR